MNSLFETSKYFTLKKSTYVFLRWIGILGQLFSISLVYFIFDFKFNFYACFWIIFVGGLSNLYLDFIYKTYSKLIPNIGKIIVGEKEPYEYLVQSIKHFVNQDELIDLMKQSNFEKCSYRNLSGGIVSIHSGWKI